MSSYILKVTWKHSPGQARVWPGRFRMMHFVLPPGTGRALEIIKRRWPGATVVGVEPVEAMRKVGHEKGIPERELIGGDALNLPFEDDSFDFVIETGVLHHIKTPLKAVTFDAPPEGTQTRS